MQDHRDSGNKVPENIRSLPEFRKYHGRIDQAELVDALRMIGSEIHNQYRFIKFIGFGGMGNVYLARDMVNSRDVAIKIIKPNVMASPSLLARFDKENAAMALLRHQNVVEVYDVGEFSNRRFCVMEVLKGVDMNELLRKDGPIPWDNLKSIALQICAGVGEAHKHGIIHRDLKPANVFLVRKDEEEYAKVIDFGMVKFLHEDSNLTATGMVVGTPSYFAPEQTTGRHDYDSRVDIYAVGVMMYQLLTGRVPFDDKELADKIRRIRFEKPMPPRELKPEIPEAVETIIMKCLEKNPEDRFQTMGEMHKAISLTDGPAAYEGSIVSDDLFMEALMRDTDTPEPRLSTSRLDIRISSIPDPNKDSGETGYSEQSEGSGQVENETEQYEPVRRKSGSVGKIIAGAVTITVAGWIAYEMTSHKENLKAAYENYRVNVTAAPTPQPVESAPVQIQENGFMVRLKGPPGAFVLEINKENPRGTELGIIDRSGEFYRRFDDDLEHTIEIRRKGGTSGAFTVSPEKSSYTVTIKPRMGKKPEQPGVEFGAPVIQKDDTENFE